jgi:hypothetical protein
MFWFTNNSVLLEVPQNVGNSPILFEYFIAVHFYLYSFIIFVCGFDSILQGQVVFVNHYIWHQKN